MAAIDAELETADLSDAHLTRVKELRATGEAEHAAGNHQASVDALAEARKLLGIWQHAEASYRGRPVTV